MAERIARRRAGVALVLSCEHGGNRVPARWAACFEGRAAVAALRSHRGWDPGALGLARVVSRECGAPLEFTTVTRLLVEANRSLHHRALFSEYTKGLDGAAKTRIVRDHYTPYRRRVEALVRERVRAAGAALHVSVHTFTPALNGEVRDVDIGLLYDPRRAAEKRICAEWRRRIIGAAPGLRVRMNRPYKGVADGFVTHLRTAFPAQRYVGVELEVNQRFPLTGGASWRALRLVLAHTLLGAVTSLR